jgi:CRISPR-associated exonuclease Cas4
MFTVTDLKQMGYCPRIPFYRYCLPGVQVASTYTMQHGTEAGQATEDLELRRSLRAYGLREGERQFDVPLMGQIVDPLTGAACELNGRLDMLIVAGAGEHASREWIPVDFKDSMSGEAATGQNSRRARLAAQRNWQVQVAAYALLLEALHGVSIQRGFIYFIPRRRAAEVRIDAGLREETLALLRQLRESVLRERMPDATVFRARCAACEYRLLCNDV